MDAKKYSQADLEEKNYLREILWNFSRVINIAHFYQGQSDIEHPTILSSLTDWFEHMSTYLLEHPAVTIEENNDIIYANKVEFPPKSPVLKKLLTNLLNSRIGLISFQRGLSLDETKSFLGFFTLALDQIESIQETSKRFAALKLEHIQIEYAEYRKVSEKEKVYASDIQPAGPKPLLASDNIKLVSDFLKRYGHPVPSGSEDDPAAKPGRTKPKKGGFDLVMDAGQISGLMLAISSGTDQAEKTGEDRPARIISYLWAISNYLLEQVQEGKSASRCLKHLDMIGQELDRQASDSGLSGHDLQDIKSRLRQMQRTLEMESLLINWQKETKKLDKLAKDIVKQLAELDPMQASEFIKRIKKIKQPGRFLTDFLHANEQ